MRRIAKTREQRLDAPRHVINADLKTVGQFWRTTSGFWAWQSNSGKLGLAHTAAEAVARCCAA